MVAQYRTILSFDQDTIEIGGSARLKINILGGSARSPISLDLSSLDSIKILEIIDQEGTIDERIADVEIEALQENANRRIKGKELSKLVREKDTSFMIRFWDVGYHFVPNVGFEYIQDSLLIGQGGASILVMPPEEIINSAKDSIQLAPIKPIIKEPVHWTDYKPYILGLSVLLLALLIIWLIRKFRKRKDIDIEEIVIVRPAHEIALAQLHRLDEDKIWQKGDIKSFQSSLTHIIREYLENRFDIPALESTTNTILHALRNEDISDEYNRILKEILQIADLVKFAKAKPEMDIHQRFLDQARDFVRTTKKIEIVQEEIEND
jgi:hypothetical protein